MLLSEAIEQLTALMNEHGDVWLCTYDTYFGEEDVEAVKFVPERKRSENSVINNSMVAHCVINQDVKRIRGAVEIAC